MKNLLIKTHPATLVVSWFAVISVIAMVLTACGTGYVSCDAYGDSGVDSHVLEEDKV